MTNLTDDNIDLTKVLYNQNKFEIISIERNFPFLCTICNKIQNASITKIKFLNDDKIRYLNFNFNQIFLPLILNTNELNIFTVDQKVYTICNICYSEFINSITQKQLDGIREKN